MRLPWSGRSPRHTYTYHAPAGARQNSPPPPPPPQPRELIDVVGVGVTETVNGIGVTLLSVERYREGYVALFRMFRQRARSERELPMPRLELSVAPVGSSPYRFQMMGGAGGGVEGEMEYRQAYAITPRPPSDGNEVVIEVREISWDRLGHGTREAVSVDTGPWRFSIR